MAARKSKSRTAPKSDRITDADVNAAVTIITRDYIQDVQGIAEDILKDVKSGEISDDEALEERINQEVDGSARVIYTWQSRLGLLASRHYDAYEEEYGEATTDVAKLMYAAMVQDLREELGDVEFND